MTVTKEAVLAAIKQCDEMGAEAFCKAHGYSLSVKYVLVHGGKPYPSKAILGVAAGLRGRDFSGGAYHVGRVLGRLGFKVRGFTRTVAAMFAAAAALGYAGVAEAELADRPVAYFASGSNHAGEIAGWAKIGHDIGVAAPEINAAAEAALGRLAGTDIQIFVDSGAFSEVAFGADGPKVVKPISDADWRERIDLYKRLAAKLGDQLHVVAPDQVGFQQETLDRLTRYADDMRQLHAMGARVLVPMQKGQMTQADFAKAADAVLGFDYVPSLPLKKAATTVAEVAAFVQARQPRQLHLLGLGVSNRNAEDYFDAVHGNAPDCLFTCDSNLIRAHVGRGGSKGDRKPGRLTMAMDVLARVFDQATWTTARRKAAGIVLCFGWGTWIATNAGGAAPQLG